MLLLESVLVHKGLHFGRSDNNYYLLKHGFILQPKNESLRYNQVQLTLAAKNQQILKDLQVVTVTYEKAFSKG